MSGGPLGGAGPPLPQPLHPERLAGALFRQFQELIYREAGLFFRPEKEALISARLGRRVRALGLPGYAAYLERVLADRGERQQMLDAVCTGHTQFFREQAHFDFVAQALAPAWRAEAAAGRRPRAVRAWSAACSTGEEPFSLAMALLDALGEGWAVQVLATDLSLTALERARRGAWPREKLADVPRRFHRFLERTSPLAQGEFEAGPQLRACLRFAQANLHDPRLPVPGPFDAIFCRNVLIYFDARARAAAVQRLVQRLPPGGHLFLGHTEALAGQVRGLARAGPSIYTAGGP